MYINGVKHQSGNVLFLILIAVALFAALSYAVTSSTRSGGGDISREKKELAISQMLQYGASLKTAAMRMVVSNGIAPVDLKINNGFSESTDICAPGPNASLARQAAASVKCHAPI